MPDGWCMADLKAMISSSSCRPASRRWLAAHWRSACRQPRCICSKPPAGGAAWGNSRGHCWRAGKLILTSLALFVNQFTMNSFAPILRALQAAIAARAARDRSLTVLLVALWGRVARMGTRLERLIALWRAGWCIWLTRPTARSFRSMAAIIRGASIWRRTGMAGLC